MKDENEVAARLGELGPLATLLVAHAPVGGRQWARLCWFLDQRLADVVRRASEPTIGAIRLAWWDAVLVEGDPARGRGEPLVEAWRALAAPEVAAQAERLIDGWRMLLAPEPLTASDLADFGARRGGGLFALLAAGHGAGEAEAIAKAGAVWALWDLAAHARDPSLAQAALDQARQVQQQVPPLPRDRALKPLRLAHDLGSADAIAGRVPAGFEGRHYRRLIWSALFG